MVENETSFTFMEGPQGAGKTLATKYLTSLGYTPVRGIPLGEKLIKNTNYQNWHESLEILEDLVRREGKYVSDRSLWSIVVFNMRKYPEQADRVYALGSKMFGKKIGNIDHKVVIIFSSPGECVQRANPSVVAITNIKESEKEINAYKELLGRLKEDGFRAFSLNNEHLPEPEFLKQIASLITSK